MHFVEFRSVFVYNLVLKRFRRFENKIWYGC